MRARVIHIITRLELGGAQQNTLFTVSHLDRERFSAALWSGEGGMLDQDAGNLSGVEFRKVPPLLREISPANDLRALLMLRGMLKEELRKWSPHPVIVHTHSSKAGILGRWAAFGAGVPVIIHTFHGFGFNDYQPFWLRDFYIMAEWLTARATHAFICVSRANLERAVSLGFGARDKFRLIRSGIDVKEFERNPIDVKARRRELGLGEEGPLVSMVSNFKPQKNPLDFARAAALVLKQVPEAWFAVAGDGELRPELETLIKEKGIGDRFRLLGWRRDIPEILWSSDLFVLTSLWEGLPRVYPQAMAAHLAIVGTRVDGAPEAVVEGENGFLVEPKDFEGLAGRIIQLLRDESLRTKMGRLGRARVDEFDIHLMLRQQEELYRDILMQKGYSGN
jgi:glycosyltransferase involved in cell wall biosynthesis